MTNKPAAIGDQFFELSLDLLAVAGLDGRFRRVNPSWTRVLGWSEAELVAAPVLDWIHEDDRAATLAARSGLGRGVPLIEFTNRYRCKDGSYRWLEWRSVADVERGLVYAAARDITDRRQAQGLHEQTQKQLVFADRMASVGTLAAGAAHEINNPLAYLTANVGTLLDGLRELSAEAPSERLQELQEMAIDAAQGAERVRQIVRGLMTFARADEERRAVVSVRSILELSIELASSHVRQRARLVRAYGETPPVEADDARLGQVFINLLVNAGQAIAEGDAETNEIRITTSTDCAGRAVVEISDTGAGVPEALRARIFDPFFTTKDVGVGTGLGLSICHTIVTGMGGEISVHGEPGRGATFRVTLPASSASALPASDPPVPVPSRKAKILVVDDDHGVGVSVGRVLRDHDVFIVTRARDALALMSAGNRFDLILSDLMMPEMSGMDLHDEVLRRDPEAAARIVFITAGAFTPAADAFLERVTNERIAKPFSLAELRALVQRRLEALAC